MSDEQWDVWMREHLDDGTPVIEYDEDGNVVINDPALAEIAARLRLK